MEIPEENDIYLVFGAITKLGESIILNLLSSGKVVRILTKHKDKTSKVFEKHLEQIESIVECDVLKSKPEEIQKAFLPNKELNKNVSYVISILEKARGNDNELILISKAVTSAIKDLKLRLQRYVHISTAHVTQPYKVKVIWTNLFYNYYYHYRLEAENVIRKSGLPYLIIRPTTLIEDSKKTQFTLDQGDRLSGSITTTTAGKLIVDMIFDRWIFDNTTIECTSSSEQKLKDYKYLSSSYHFANDKELEQINHKSTSRLYGFGTTLLLIFGIVKIIKLIQNWKRLQTKILAK